jgi:phosphonate transport system substrate-binding protein
MSIRSLVAAGIAVFSFAVGISTASAQAVLNIGLVPSEDPRVVVSDNQALLEHLRSALGVEVKPFVATDYTGVIEAMRAKKLDAALLGPFAYVLAHQVAGADAFALLETQKQGPSYHAVIIARKDRGIASLNDLRGKTFAFVDPSSTSGHLFPKAALLKAGLNPDTDFARTIFSGGHDASAVAVQNGKVDAAAIADALLDAAYARGMLKQEDIVVVWKSDAIPGAPVVYRRDLPEAMKTRLRNAFGQVHDMAWGPKTTIKRFVPVEDNAYDVVRETAQVLKLDLSKMK